MHTSNPHRRRFVQALAASVGSTCLGGCGGSEADDSLAESVTVPPQSTDTVPPPTQGNGEGGGAAAATTTQAAGSIRFTSDRSGRVPVLAATGLRRGQYPTGTDPVASVPDVDVVVKRRWSDGSAKHVVVTGLLDVAAGVPVDVGLASGVRSASRMNESAIVAAKPQASVSGGGITIHLSSLLGRPVRTWLATANMVECHYLSRPHPDVYVWFHVRCWAGGQVWVRIVVEHARMPFTERTQLEYVPSVSIGGRVVWNNQGNAYHHWLATRWSVEGWAAGGADVTVRHDPLTLAATGLVPNYFKRAPTQAQLAALKTRYEPGSVVGLRVKYGLAGYGEQIGLLPLWDVCYLVSGDQRAWRAVQANALAAGTHATIWRDADSARTIRLSSYPGWSYAGDGRGGFTYIDAGDGSLAATPQWDVAHHASSGYLAYLLTGDFLYFETLQMQCAGIYLSQSRSQGLGTARILAKAQAARGVAWAIRSLGQMLALAPEDDADGAGVVADMRQWLQRNIDYHKAAAVDNPAASRLGFVEAIGNQGLSTGSGELRQSVWMWNFWAQAMGHVCDIEPYADMAAFNAVRDFLYGIPVGLLGDGSAGTYHYAYAGWYRVQISDARPGAFDNTPATQLYGDWGQVFDKTYARINGDLASYGRTWTQQKNPGNVLLKFDAGDYSDWGYFANLLPAIAHAVDHRKPGAREAWLRLTGASNWATFEATLNTQLNWAIAPREAIGVQLPQTPPDSRTRPAWRNAMAPRTWCEVPTANTLAAIDPARNPLYNPNHPGLAPWNGGTGFRSLVSAWCGACFDEATDTLWIPIGGGHGDYAGNEPYRIRLDQDRPTWQMLRPPSGSIPLGLITLNDGKHSSGVYADGRPRPIHTYNGLVYVPGHGPIVPIKGAGYPGVGADTDETRRGWQLDETSGEWRVIGQASGYLDLSGAGACHDPSRRAIWFRTPGGHMRRFDLDTMMWSRVGELLSAPGYGLALTYVPGHDVILCNGGRDDGAANVLRVFDPADSTWHAPAVIGTAPAGLAWNGSAQPRWVPELGAACLWNHDSGTATIGALAPVGDPRAAWSWSALVPATSNTTAPTGRSPHGTYGRFVYSPRLEGFFLLNAIGEPVYFFALS